VAKHTFDEVMIVNPSEPGAGSRGAAMRFHYAEAPPEYGYYAEAPEYGYYAEPEYGYAEPEVGYYGEAPEYGWYGQAPEYGYYGEGPEFAEPEYGYYAEDPYGEDPYGEDPYGEDPYGEDPYGEDPYGEEPYGYAEGSEFADWGETEPGYAEPDPVGYFAQEQPMAGYAKDPSLAWGEASSPQFAAHGWGQVPEMVGYGPMGEAPLEYYGEPELAAYVRDVRAPAFNAGCPMPTNTVGGYEESPLEGYVKPTPVSPRCESFATQPGPTPAVPETFKPLW
jgi:hypothetical protein